jgi:hypothetical protein
MKEIKIINSEEITKFDNLSVNEQFIVDFRSCQFFAVKSSDNFAAIINADNEFVVAQRFINCLSMGWGRSAYKKYEDCLSAILRYEELKKKYPNRDFVTPNF